MYFSHINTESAEYALGYRSLKTSPVQIAMCSLSSIMISMVSLLNDTEREVQNIEVLQHDFSGATDTRAK